MRRKRAGGIPGHPGGHPGQGRRTPGRKGEIIKAAKKPVPAWSASQVRADPAGAGKAGARNPLLKLFSPSCQRKCEMATGETPAEAAAKLAEKIAGFKA